MLENQRIVVNTLESSWNVDIDNVIGHKKSQSIRETRLCLLPAPRPHKRHAFLKSDDVVHVFTIGIPIVIDKHEKT